MGEEKVLREFPDKQIIIDIPEELEDDNQKGTPKWIIYKVPNKLRKIRPAAYTPQLVSIGPIHYGKSNLKAMEHYKTKYMKAFLKRASRIEDDLIHFMQEGNRLQLIRHSYAVTFKPVNRSNKCRRRTSSFDTLEPAAADEKDRWLDFIGMILRDACFIFELFLRNHETRLHETSKEKLPDEIKNYSEDYILRSPWLKAAITQDLILLENQLPYSDLTQLFDYIFPEPSDNSNKNYHGCLTKITCEFFIDYYRFGRPRPDPEESSQKTPTSAADPDPEESLQKTRLSATDSNETGQKNPCNKDNDPLVTELIGRKEAALNKIQHFTDLVRQLMFEENDYTKPEHQLTCEENEITTPEHLTDQLMCKENENTIPEHFTHCLYSAKQLSNAGVVFGLPENAKFLAEIEMDWNQKCWRNDKCCSWRNSCCCCWINGLCGINCLKLKIPPLKVQDNTECIFRNVMALEQFVYPNDPRICSYIYLLDQLISTVEDVDLLVGKKIIDNLLGSNKAVADLVNKLCDQIVIEYFFYSCICKQINEHHGKKLNVARSTLRRVYFKDIWTGSSTLLGLVFLVFSGFSVASTIKNIFF